MKNEIRVLPEVFLERLRQIIPFHKWDAIANTFAEKKPTSFRVNTLKAATDIVKNELEKQNFRLERVSWYPDAFILRQGCLRDLQETQIYQKGEIYVQSLNSMLPPLMLTPEPGENILDLTAAPGSKTTQIACLMQGKGRILANDNNKVRYFRLKANVEMQAATNVETSLRYGESFGKLYPEKFDRVLLDAPCSAEGRFDIHEPASYRYWKPSKIREMVRKQKKLFFSAILTLRSGGVLVYSTCTFAPEENEGVLDWALEKFEGQIEVETIRFPLANQMQGLASWGGGMFRPSVKKSVRILPNAQMEGFFIAKIKKT
jgi:16S rRNA (cytosine1407-C5)-methyltransferase